ncbi:hypothetical protein NDU88_003641 [Pleurodeles waltl]|uniref:Secreted protein n=1 Tax=Pleurodeles waltl TaxID=8319 RepID=A0AAV7RIT2_PLEWA|nr:hypothetical protein NDU88_003641 [Pleurodeles waltl]
MLSILLVFAGLVVVSRCWHRFLEASVSAPSGCLPFERAITLPIRSATNPLRSPALAVPRMPPLLCASSRTAHRQRRGGGSGIRDQRRPQRRSSDSHGQYRSRPCRCHARLTASCRLLDGRPIRSRLSTR